MADRWVRWTRVTRGDGTTKRPLTASGAAASSTDPGTWSPLVEAEASNVGDGIGFALGGGFACIDLDHCYDGRNHLEWWAKMLIAPVAGRAYIEISPSGTGLHVWGLLDPRPGMRLRNDLGMNIEIYSRDRFVTLTGRRHRDSGTGLPDMSNLWAVCERLR